MAEFVENTLQPYFNFWVYVILMMIGLWALIAKNNLIKKLIGLSIFQTAIILFYVSLGVKEGATIPILDHHGHAEHVENAGAGHGEGEKHADQREPGAKAKPEAKPESGGHHGEPGEAGLGKKADRAAARDRAAPGDHGAHADATSPDPDTMANPLPHVLMLTAIVVGVATVGVALAISQMIFREFGSLEEDEILEEIKSGNADG